MHTPQVPTHLPSRAAVFTWIEAAVPWLDVAMEMDGQAVHFVFNISQPEARSFLHRVVDTGAFPTVWFTDKQARSCRIILLDECFSIREALWNTEGRAEACTTAWGRPFDKMCCIAAQEFAADDSDLLDNRFVLMQPDRMHHRAALAALGKL